MKITITPSGLSAAAFTLADDTVSQVMGATFTNGAGGQVEGLDGFVPTTSRMVQETKLFRGAYVFLAPRFNLKSAFSFRTHRVHDKVENCLNFVCFHKDLVPVQGEITLSHTSATGTFRAYLPNAIIVVSDVIKQRGVMNLFRYDISAPNPWQTAP